MSFNNILVQYKLEPLTDIDKEIFFEEAKYFITNDDIKQFFRFLNFKVNIKDELKDNIMLYLDSWLTLKKFLEYCSYKGYSKSVAIKYQTCNYELFYTFTDKDSFITLKDLEDMGYRYSVEPLSDIIDKLKEQDLILKQNSKIEKEIEKEMSKTHYDPMGNLKIPEYDGFDNLQDYVDELIKVIPTSKI
ncbi:hypothetical protein [Ligilactobacillus equi]|uniref:Uncharacterized protein n=1 Tax=Ligilactobacillus equi DSM 15833 = JCM 10991 TaxID=1423740 RepID=A0A0R1T9T2_9LACO|nr:hypothetical protein [Ligilactobacillus equi]KRL78127.1 hypothetical protein FC36_GL001177 [Ligilactobacillus equi DSM 15833 = JCM 10991]